MERQQEMGGEERSAYSESESVKEVAKAMAEEGGRFSKPSREDYALASKIQDEMKDQIDPVAAEIFTKYAAEALQIMNRLSEQQMDALRVFVETILQEIEEEVIDQGQQLMKQLRAGEITDKKFEDGLNEKLSGFEVLIRQKLDEDEQLKLAFAGNEDLLERVHNFYVNRTIATTRVYLLSFVE